MSRNRTEFNINEMGRNISATQEKHVEQYQIIKLS